MQLIRQYFTPPKFSHIWYMQLSFLKPANVIGGLDSQAELSKIPYTYVTCFNTVYTYSVQFVSPESSLQITLGL